MDYYSSPGLAAQASAGYLAGLPIIRAPLPTRGYPGLNSPLSLAARSKIAWCQAVGSASRSKIGFSVPGRALRWSKIEIIKKLLKKVVSFKETPNFASV